MRNVGTCSPDEYDSERGLLTLMKKLSKAKNSDCMGVDMPFFEKGISQSMKCTSGELAML